MGVLFASVRSVNLCAVRCVRNINKRLSGAERMFYFDFRGKKVRRKPFSLAAKRRDLLVYNIKCKGLGINEGAVMI